MNRSSALSQALLVTALTVSAAPLAHADVVTVQATAVIYAAGTQSSLASSAGGTLPNAIAVASGNQSFTFATSGTITLNNGTYNDADGNFSAVSSSSTGGYGYISGITAPGAGYLVGVFLPSSTLASAPASPVYSADAETRSSYSPLLGQVFFIGDGLTGDGTGSVQSFLTPTGAAMLYLGISDAGGYNGNPGSYGDNFGAFSVAVNAVGSVVPPPPPPPVTTPVPEPSSLLLLGSGAFGMISAVRRRLQR